MRAGLFVGLGIAALSMTTGCGPDCQTTCEKLYSKGGECKMTNAGDPTGEETYQYCMETCNEAMAKPGESGDYNPEEKVPSSESITIVNDQQAAMWMDCIEAKSCQLLDSSAGGRFCAPIW